jgi:hypothetical protein
MSGRTRTNLRTNLSTLIALLALVVACGGTAVAAGLAKDSVTSKSIKNNAVKSKDLKDGGVTSVDLKDGTVDSADVKDDTLTGADIGEGSLGIVPNATAVGGVQITPLSVSLPSGTAAVPVLSESGTVVSLDCTGNIVISYSRGASGPPLVLSSVTGGAATISPAPSESGTSGLAAGHHTATIVLPGGGSVTATFAGLYEVNASGANDCFYRGTITRVP